MQVNDQASMYYGLELTRIKNRPVQKNIIDTERNHGIDLAGQSFQNSKIEEIITVTIKGKLEIKCI